MPIIDGHPDSLPSRVTLDEYAVARVQEDVGDTSQEKATAAVRGLLLHAYMALVTDSDDSYQNLKGLADRVYKNYTGETSSFGGKYRIPLPPYRDMVQEVVNELLDPQQGLPYEARAVLRQRLGLPPEKAAPAPAPAPPATGTTNAPAATTTNVPPVE